jgi:hypothetical protein
MMGKYSLMDALVENRVCDDPVEDFAVYCIAVALGLIEPLIPKRPWWEALLR